MSYYVLFNVMALIGELCLKKNKKDRAQDYSLSKEVSKLEKKTGCLIYYRLDFCSFQLEVMGLLLGLSRKVEQKVLAGLTREVQHRSPLEDFRIPRKELKDFKIRSISRAVLRSFIIEASSLKPPH